MPKIELTNMVMIQDNNTGKVLVQDRTKSWKGLSFPGGHVEEGESFVDSAIREIKEETGLNIKNLQACGVIHWCNNKNYDRYIEFLYKTTDFSGELLSESEEGKVYWMLIEQIMRRDYTNNFDKYLPMFIESKYNEGFGLWDNGPCEIVYK